MFNRSSPASSFATLASLLLVAVSLPACSRQSTPLAAISTIGSPAAPRLDPQTRQSCPDLPRVSDGSAVGIASADASSSIEYRKCQARHDGAVGAFDALADAYEKLRAATTVGVKGGKHGK